MVLTLRSRYVFFPTLLALAALTLIFFRFSSSSQPAPPDDGKPKLKPHPLYKPPGPEKPPPLPEYFPLAASAKSPADLPPVPSWNKPPEKHVPENTRLYIGFTRYWPLLQQVVVSYIAAGWPPSDIYVVENTGTFDANRKGLLTSQNPFYLDYHRLTKIFGVNVMTTPSLQSFAQLQNLYLSEAINNNLTYYFWGHMDVVAQTHEDAVPYRSLYQIAVDTIRESMDPSFGVDPETKEKKQWAIRFFSYDWFALVNVDSYIKVGGWDSMISYYGTDCDMHSRIAMNGLTTPIADAGQIFDVGRSLDDLEVLFRRRKTGVKAKREVGGAQDTKHKEGSTGAGSTVSNSAYLKETEEDELGGESWKKLQVDLEAMAEEKRTDPYRNSWQLKQKGGQGEPYYYNAEGWEKALQMTIDTGTKIYNEKWGHRGCDIRDVGLKEGDQWRVEHDW